MSFAPKVEIRFPNLPTAPALGSVRDEHVAEDAAIQLSKLDGLVDDDGKIIGSLLPALAIGEVFDVSSQVEMLALVAERGDFARRSDLGYAFVLIADDPTQLINWKQLDTGYALNSALTSEITRATNAENTLTASLTALTPQLPFFVDLYKTADNTWYDAMSAAYTAAKVGGGIVQFGHGVYDIGKAGVHSLDLSPNQPYLVTFKGMGKTATYIKLSGVTTTFLTMLSGGSTVTHKNWAVEDLTVDSNNVASYDWPYLGVIMCGGTLSNMDHISVRRVDTINVGPASNTGIPRRNISIGNSEFHDSQVWHLTNFVFEDCYFGKSGGGGNYGVHVQGFAFVRKDVPTLYANPGTSTTSAIIDLIRISNCVYDSGASHTTAPGGDSCGFMVGGDALVDRVLIENCSTANSCDDLMEVNGARSLIVRGCTFQDGNFSQCYINNQFGYWPQEQQHILVEGCTFIQKDVFCPPLELSGRMPMGEIVVKDSTFIGGEIAIHAGDNIAKLSIKDCNHVITSRTATASTNNQIWQNASIEIATTGGRCVAVVDGFHVFARDSYNSNGHTGVQGIREAVLVSGNDVDLTTKNITMDVDFTTVGNPTTETRSVRVGTIADIIDTFSSDTFKSYFYQLDAGDTAQLTRSGNVYNPNTAITSELRLFQYTNTTFQAVGPFADVCAYVKIQPGATVTGFKGGVVFNRIDANNYMEASVLDDGTNSYLRLDSVVAGTRTALAGPTTLGSRITASTYLWIRALKVGDVVTASIHTSKPTRSAVGTSTLTATLTGTTKTLFRECGLAGVVWLPDSLTSALDEFGVRPMTVFSGEISHINPAFTRNVTTARAVVVDPDSTTMRLNGLTIHDCNDMKNQGATTAVGITGLTDVAFAGLVNKYGNFWADGSVDPMPRFTATRKTITGAYTLKATDSGCVLVYDSASSANITVPSTLPSDFAATLIMANSGTPTVVAGGGATVDSYDSFTKPAGLKAALSIYAVATGSVLLSGRGA